jgi:hypothetical protein
MEESVKATTEILNLIAFLLGSPEFALAHAQPWPSRHPLPEETKPAQNEALAKKAANS